jgi:hypothetical protein
MRKHVLLFVHGMGAYVTQDGKPDDTWFNDCAAALKEQYVKYPLVNLKSFEDAFEIVHINYDTVIFELVTRWQTESQAILAAGIPAAAPAEKLVGWLKDAAKLDNNFAWSHAACVILYRFFPLMRQRIKINVAAQFQKALAANHDGAVSTWSVIAHSLGTMVTHDVLQALDSTTPNEAGISILDAMVPSANLVAMIANVSRVLQKDSDVYNSLVIPQSMIQNQAACYSYLSTRNEFDPFVRVNPFDPGDLPAWNLARSNGSFVEVFAHNIHDLDPHSFRNYIVNPAVHIPLLIKLVGPGAITDAQAREAIGQFQNVPMSTVQQAFQTVVQKIQPELAGKADFSAWFDWAGRFYAELKKLQGGSAPAGAAP